MLRYLNFHITAAKRHARNRRPSIMFLERINCNRDVLQISTRLFLRQNLSPMLVIVEQTNTSAVKTLDWEKSKAF